jgi:16S rRNA (cytosine1402-N4)-methyltransferase
MAERVVALLAPALARPGAVFVDATLGAGGHSALIAQACPDARLIGIDRDDEAIAIATDRLAALASAKRFQAVHANYDEIADVAQDLGLDRVDAALFDLGVSSMQLDEPDRGFAYAHDAALDMRMDPASGSPTAADVLNTYPERDLARVLRDYGEERFAQRIAHRLVERRAARPWATTRELAEAVRDAIPAAARRTGGNPAKRTFQALRIEVNGELDHVAAAIPAAIGLLPVGGRIAVLAYHSLEDRIVKRALAAGAATLAPPDLPVIPEDQQPELKLLTRGAEKPGAAELETNPRSASARLRAAERIRPARPLAAHGHGPGSRRTPRTRATAQTARAKEAKK